MIAASPGLGTINHTLLTIEAARAAGLEVAAVVLTPWPEEPSEIERSNRETIAALGGVAGPDPAAARPRRPATWPPSQLMGRYPPIGDFRPINRVSRDDDVEAGAGELDLEAGARDDRRGGLGIRRRLLRQQQRPRHFAPDRLRHVGDGLALAVPLAKARTASSVACFGFQAAA